jgi:alkylation response protein AidB-like acyl-CoA dehydrogenase
LLLGAVVTDWLATAARFADDFLFPTASDVDAMDVVPRERLDRLAAEGVYGLAAPGLGVASIEEAHPINAAFAGGCMTTTLVWVQHHGGVASCAFGPESVQSLVPRLAAGDLRSTVAFAGLLPEPRLRCRQDGVSWIVDGTAPWVSGWGLTDLIHMAARAPNDDVVWLLADTSDAGFRAERHRLLGMDASATVTLHVDGVRVDADRMTSRFPWSEWPARDAAGLRTNGSMALGVAARCLRLLGPSPLDDDLVAATRELDDGNADTFPAARATASLLAVRAATALVVEGGSGAVERGTDAERLYREAAMLVVFGSRPSIKAELTRGSQQARSSSSPG